ncbi:MAG: DNA-binding protein [Limisphaerales bacterium]
MPEEETIERAREDEREGKSPSTQAGEFVREEFHHIREGQPGARSPQQAIAIGLSKARRADVNLRPPTGGRSSARVRRQAERDYEKGRRQPGRRPSPRQSRATLGALKREGRQAASTGAISRQTRAAAQRRSSAERSTAARKAARTKGHSRLSAAAKKAARTRWG